MLSTAKLLMPIKNCMQRLLYSLFFFTLLLQGLPAASQVLGCRDPMAKNYNVAATVNDGSCQYDTASYTPPVKVDPISNALTESSGLQWAGNSLWSFNDSGNDPVLFRMDTASSAILQTVTLGGATNVDWEDIAFDGTYIYIGDFGNNSTGDRTDLKIYKLKLSDIPGYASNPAVTIPPEKINVIRFSYADQKPVVATGANNTAFDCEAMLVDDGKIHLFTKNWVDQLTAHYVISSTMPGDYVAAKLETLNTNFLVTAADKAPGTNAVVLFGYQNLGLADHYMYLLSDYNGGLYFNGNKRVIKLPNATIMGQGEGITFYNSRYGFLSNEFFQRSSGPFTITVNQKLRTFSLDSFLPVYVLPVELKNFSAVKQSNGNAVSWTFTGAVNELQLQSSANRTGFTTLQRFAASASGSYLHLSAAAVDCYRLAWKDVNKQDIFSDTICLNNGEKGSFSQLVLHATGELSFFLAAAEARQCTFRLLTTDGRLVAQTARQVVTPGANRIRFAALPCRGAIVLVQLLGAEEKRSLLLHVE